MDEVIEDLLEGPDRDEILLSLECANFSVREIVRTALPKHILAWLRDLPDRASYPDDFRNMRYYRIRTDVGSFGIVFGPYPAIDLDGTGVRAADLVAGVPETAEGFPFLPLRDIDALVNLWQCLLEQQAGQIPE